MLEAYLVEPDQQELTPGHHQDHKHKWHPARSMTGIDATCVIGLPELESFNGHVISSHEPSQAQQAAKGEATSTMKSFTHHPPAMAIASSIGNECSSHARASPVEARPGRQVGHGVSAEGHAWHLTCSRPIRVDGQYCRQAQAFRQQDSHGLTALAGR